MRSRPIFYGCCACPIAKRGVIMQDVPKFTRRSFLKAGAAAATLAAAGLPAAAAAPEQENACFHGSPPRSRPSMARSWASRSRAALHFTASLMAKRRAARAAGRLRWTRCPGRQCGTAPAPGRKPVNTAAVCPVWRTACGWTSIPQPAPGAGRYWSFSTAAATRPALPRSCVVTAWWSGRNVWWCR